MVVVGDHIYGLDLIERRSMFPSNHDRRSSDGRLTAPDRAAAALTSRRGGAIAGLIRASGTVAMGHGGGRSYVQNEAVVEGILTLWSLTIGMSPSGLATVSSSSSLNCPAMVLLQGSPVATKVKERSTASGNALHPKESA
jgi:hypothetical protein